MIKLNFIPGRSKKLVRLVIILALVVALPLFIWAVVTLNFNPFRKAASGEPIPTSPPTVTPINWSVGTISITADNFYIISNGKRYDGNSNINVNPGPSGPAAQGIEIASNQYGDELKLQIMFRKDPNNYTWWADHIAFINSNYASYVSSYDGTFFRSLLGQPFVDSGNVAMIVRNPNDGQQVAELHYTNLHIRAFSGQTPPPTACPPFPLTFRIDGVSGTTGMNQPFRYYMHVTHNDPNCLGGVTVNLSARLPDGWRAAFETPSFYLNSNTTYNTTVEITPTTFNQIGEPIIIYANTNYPPNAATQEVQLRVGPTNVPTSTPGTYYCNRSCRSNYDCLSSLVCSQGFCRNSACPSNSSCACDTIPQPTVRPPAGECEMCGGIAGIRCQTGLFCQYSQPNYSGRPNYPDQSGICVNRLRPGRCPVPTPQVTPPPTVRPFQILFKFDGVTDDSALGARVSARLISSSMNNKLGYVTPQLPLVYGLGGVYKLYFGAWSTQIPPANDYSIILKGEKHLAVKFCQSSGQVAHCASSDPGKITIPSNPESLVYLDFTGVPLLAGDTPPQDGVVNPSDFAKVVALLAKPCSQLTDADKAIGDLDYNGCVNVKDIFLLRKTLETRYDDF